MTAVAPANNSNFDELNVIDASYLFDFEFFIKNDLKINLDKPMNLEKPICKYFVMGNCAKGANCENRHTVEKTVVCKHWLRGKCLFYYVYRKGLCKKGDLCEFLHEYNLKKMPECWFFTKNGECSNPECLYRHIDPNSKIRDCAWYQRGFCKHGQNCRHKHTRLAPCQLYLTGFCPKGSSCKQGHPKFELPNLAETQAQAPVEVEHHAPPVLKASTGYRPLEEVVCFKCGDKGHFANHCPKRKANHFNK